MFKQIHKDSLYYGFPVTLLATQSIDGTDNISPISSSWTLNNHVVLGVSLEGQAYQNMLTTKEATINIADSKIWSNIERIARRYRINWRSSKWLFAPWTLRWIVKESYNSSG